MEEIMVVPISGPIDLKGKVAIVTGGARGIGQASCWSLAREGVTVAVCDVLPVKETLAGLKKFGHASLGLRCDIQRKGEIVKAVERVMKKFGGIDILVANAGIFEGKSITEVDVPDWDRMVEINLRGPFLFCQQVWPIMQKQGFGKIICVGSSAGKTGGVLAGPHYAAAKGGVHALVKWMAKNGAAHGILVNGIAPGPTVTPMTINQPFTSDGIPVGRMGHPEDIAEAVVFLASQASNFVTGVILDVNGGLYMA
jgi:3-oxoacyl-[acyl-carrier protein] reductase